MTASSGMVEFTDEELESLAAQGNRPALAALVGRIVREELRRVGLRPPVPGPGAWRWNHEADGWESGC